MNDIKLKLKEYKEYFENTLRCFFDGMAKKHVEEPIFSAIKYSIENGGKRIRPFLVYLGAEFMGHDKAEVEKLAIAIELIHSYSLVHDDLPSMDNDTLRRNMPTTHIRFGEGMAVLTGDAMLNLAVECALENADINNSYIKALKYIMHSSGVFGMVGGQCIDIRDNAKEGMSFDGLIELYRLKTSELIGAALVGGAIACGATDEDVDALKIYADNVGVIFQIVDDILDVTSSEAVLGKNINSDAESGKVTSLDYMSLKEAKEYINMLDDEVCAVMKKYGDKAHDLISLHKMLMVREK